MKKLICLICLTVFILSLSACDAHKPQSEISDTDTQSTPSTEVSNTDSQTTSSTQAPDKDFLKIKIQPQNVTVNEGETATFSIEAEGGKAPYEYMWLTTSAQGEMPANQELQTNTISFPNVDINFNGVTYFCRVTDADNHTVESEKVKITVTPATKKETITLTFDAKGGSRVSSMEVEKGKPFGNLPVTARQGYRFIAWTDRHGMPFYPDSTSNNDLALYATWEKLPETITVTFYLENSTDSFATLKIEKGKPFGTLPTPPAKAGYVFMAWADRHGMPFYPDSTSNNDLALYATWSEDD